jgi:hypothetical protein
VTTIATTITGTAGDNESAPHSYLSAVIGLTRVARRAGT